jgi:hypothetical protein
MPTAMGTAPAVRRASWALTNFKWRRTMRKMSLLAAIAILSLAGGTAVAEEKPAKPVKEKKICKSEPDSASRLGKKQVCKTKAEWARQSNPEGLDADNKLRGMNRGN